MKLSTIDTGYFKLDGGAMFGVVPKQMWNKINPADENNMCSWAMRCLLIQDGDRNIVVDTGMGDKQGEKFKSYFEPFGEDTLLSSLAKKGLQPEDITDVFITHLHFDHVGGAVDGSAGNYYPTFPNATYWCNEEQYQLAMNPNPREKASFLKENFVPLMDAGVVKFIAPNKGFNAWTKNIDVLTVYGHTAGMMIPVITVGDRKVAFCADLLPSAGHLGLPYVMCYDVQPLVTIEEKRDFLQIALEENYILFLEHDRNIECITIGLNERGRHIIKEKGDLASFF